MFLFYCSDLSQLLRYEAVLECNVVQCPQRPRRGSDHQAASSRQHQAEVRIGSNVGRSTPPSSFLHLVLNSNALLQQCNAWDGQHLPHLLYLNPAMHCSDGISTLHIFLLFFICTCNAGRFTPPSSFPDLVLNSCNAM